MLHTSVSATSATQRLYCYYKYCNHLPSLFSKRTLSKVLYNDLPLKKEEESLIVLFIQIHLDTARVLFFLGKINRLLTLRRYSVKISEPNTVNKIMP